MSYEDVKQADLFEVNWGIRADLKDYQEQLWDLIPTSGRCEFPNSKNKALDKFRRAANLTYDLFNNGLMNRRAEFRKFFGFVPIPAPRYQGHMSRERWDDIELRMEEVITPLLLAAAQEQGII